MSNIFILNGPPRSGKDTLAKHLVSQCGYFEFKFSNELKIMTHRLYGLEKEDPDQFESCKDTPNSFFYGLSPRQAYISVSENYIKPTHGKEFFGLLLAQRLKSHRRIADGNFVISDGGFVEELYPVVRTMTKSNIYLCRLYRVGYDFSKDSRNYIESAVLVELGIKELPPLINNGTIEEFTQQWQNVTREVRQLQC